MERFFALSICSGVTGFVGSLRDFSKVLFSLALRSMDSGVLTSSLDLLDFSCLNFLLLVAMRAIDLLLKFIDVVLHGAHPFYLVACLQGYVGDPAHPAYDEEQDYCGKGFNYQVLIHSPVLGST